LVFDAAHGRISSYKVSDAKIAVDALRADFSADALKSAGNTFCIAEHFSCIGREIRLHPRRL
jgi:hypothetical protein